MNLPPFVKSISFWTAVSYIIAGVLALLVQFGVLPAGYALSFGAVLSAILAVLHFLNITPEIRLRYGFKHSQD